jgi:Domain of unknown function (DUF1707)/Domain of unknown function (DUF4190)
MTVDPIFGTRFVGPPGALAADADRARAIDVLRAGFAEGRLTKTEYDDRTARVYAARTYGQLGSLTADLPAGPLGPARYLGAVYPLRPAVNSTAVTALVCGISVFFTLGLTAVPAIVLGHAARRQMRATGQRGDDMALAGVALGWAGVALLVAAVAGLVAISAVHTSHAIVVHPAPGPPGPIRVMPVFEPGGPMVGG